MSSDLTDSLTDSPDFYCLFCGGDVYRWAAALGNRMHFECRDCGARSSRLCNDDREEDTIRDVLDSRNADDDATNADIVRDNERQSAPTDFYLI